MLFKQDKPWIYAGSFLLYQVSLLGLLHVAGISLLCPVHILLFLEIYVPSVLIGLFVLHVACSDEKHSGSVGNQLLLCAYSLTATGIGAIVYHIITVLLGAAFTENVIETFLFSVLCSSLTVFPHFLVHNARWEEVVDYLPDSVDVSDSRADAIKVISFCTLVGAWLGAFPIPLDWDREWQTWPITCCVAAVCGNIFGSLYVLVANTSLFQNLILHKTKLT